MMTALALAIAGGLAGIAGGLMSTIYAVTPALGGHLILPALIVVIVGEWDTLRELFSPRLSWALSRPL